MGKKLRRGGEVRDGKGRLEIKLCFLSTNWWVVVGGGEW
jgi:hypothetical protein